MKFDHGVEPSMEHYTCIVRLLGRTTGLVNDSCQFYWGYSLIQNHLSWFGVHCFSSCIVHKNVSPGEIRSREGTHDETTYALLSNMYSLLQLEVWMNKVAILRKSSEGRWCKGRAWPKLARHLKGKVVHAFSVGDQQTIQICA
jgi:hypothetical protein